MLKGASRTVIWLPRPVVRREGFSSWLLSSNGGPCLLEQTRYNSVRSQLYNLKLFKVAYYNFDRDLLPESCLLPLRGSLREQVDTGVAEARLGTIIS